MNNVDKLINYLKQHIEGTFNYTIIESDNSFNIIGTIVVVVPKDDAEFELQFNKLKVN